MNRKHLKFILKIILIKIYYRFSTALIKSRNSGNVVPCPHIPSLTIYAIFRGSEAPVADA